MPRKARALLRDYIDTRRFVAIEYLRRNQDFQEQTRHLTARARALFPPGTSLEVKQRSEDGRKYLADVGDFERRWAMPLHVALYAMPAGHPDGPLIASTRLSLPVTTSRQGDELVLRCNLTWPTDWLLRAVAEAIRDARASTPKRRAR